MNRGLRIGIGVLMLVVVLSRLGASTLLPAMAPILAWPGQEQAGSSSSPDGEWMATAHWIWRSQENGWLRLDLQKRDGGQSVRRIVAVPLPDTVPQNENGDLEYDWDYMETGSVAVGGQVVDVE